MENFEIKKALTEIDANLKQVVKLVDKDAITKEITDNEQVMLDPEFWKNQQLAKELSQRQEFLKSQLTALTDLNNKLNHLTELAPLLTTSDEIELLISEIKELKTTIRSFKVQTMFYGQYDKSAAIFEIHAGAGGTEAMDWASMLSRMYLRFFEQNHFDVEIIDQEAGNEAGIKSVVMKVSGLFAFGYLKGESGVHRLVRISPFDANKRRHTSFAAVSVVPVIDNVSSVDIKDNDIRIDTYHSSGAGGQSVNTTMSAVRITHIPTGIVVTCQNERSQIQNKEQALKILRGKLIFLEQQKQDKELADIKGSIKNIEWGSQIRSYVFQPYQLVKDHRSNYESSKVSEVMDGSIMPFIEEYLVSR